MEVERSLLRQYSWEGRKQASASFILHVRRVQDGTNTTPIRSSSFQISSNLVFKPSSTVASLRNSATKWSSCWATQAGDEQRQSFKLRHLPFQDKTGISRLLTAHRFIWHVLIVQPSILLIWFCWFGSWISPWVLQLRTDVSPNCRCGITSVNKSGTIRGLVCSPKSLYVILSLDVSLQQLHQATEFGVSSAGCSVFVASRAITRKSRKKKAKKQQVLKRSSTFGTETRKWHLFANYKL